MTPAINYDVGRTPVSLVSSDLDNDGANDLAVTNYSSRTVAVLINNGLGAFADPVSISLGSAPASLCAAYLNDDAFIDLAVVNAGVSVFFNDGDGTFSAPVNYAVSQSLGDIAAVDIDGDTDMDLAIASAGSHNLSILFNNGDGTFSDLQNYGAGAGPNSITAGDLDGDGDNDLAFANGGSDKVCVLVNLSDIQTGVADESTVAQLPDAFNLSQNYPNPFNPDTQIEFDLPRHCHVRLEVLNVLGQKVATLVDRPMTVGHHTVSWNGADNATGLYLYRLKAGNTVISKKMLLIK